MVATKWVVPWPRASSQPPYKEHRCKAHACAPTAHQTAIDVDDRILRIKTLQTEPLRQNNHTVPIFPNTTLPCLLSNRRNPWCSIEEDDKGDQPAIRGTTPRREGQAACTRKKGLGRSLPLIDYNSH
ncbi:hypothetical protein BRADI_3g11552v3 [Brachypodium distachyon]|uniref:Uncharacterized protein n=1 Tax=Brachypodium distachyon TaxID=15368 RepID=A0A2K2CWP5_BRADI|nr:hypothetical protein BRADI_3g11552v3 [Brachypodium distachyon]